MEEEEASSTTSSFTIPLPKVVPSAELSARVQETLDKLDKKEAEEKRCREALEEKRWREWRRAGCTKSSNGEKSPLFATWADTASSASGASSELAAEHEEVPEPVKADDVGSIRLAKEASPAKDSCSPQPSQKIDQARATAAATFTAPAPQDIIPEEELKRRRRVEAELIALSKKITEEKKRQEQMVHLVWDEPTFAPFPSDDTSTGAPSTAAAASGEPQKPNPRKRPYGNLNYRNLIPIGIPPQAHNNYARDQSLSGGGGFGWQRQPSPEEIEDFVKFVDEVIPTDPRWKMKRTKEGEHYFDG